MASSPLSSSHKKKPPLNPPFLCKTLEIQDQYEFLKKLVYYKSSRMILDQPNKIKELKIKTAYKSHINEFGHPRISTPIKFDTWNSYICYVVYRMCKYCFEDEDEGTGNYNDPQGESYWFSRYAMYYDSATRSYPCLSSFPETKFNCFELCFTYVNSFRSRKVYLPDDGSLVMIHSMRPANILWDRDLGCIIDVIPLERHDETESLDVPLDLLPRMKECWFSLGEKGTNIEFYRKQGQYGFLSSQKDYWRDALDIASFYLEGILNFMSTKGYVPGGTYNRKTMTRELEEFQGYACYIDFRQVTAGAMPYLHEFRYILDRRFRNIDYRREDPLAGEEFHLEDRKSRGKVGQKQEF